MKTYISRTFFMGLLLACTVAKGQLKSQLGLVGGISQSWDIDRENNNIVNIPGYRIGLNTRIPLAKNIHFQPEIALVHRIIGYNNSNRSGGITTQSKIRNGITMIQIPVSVQFGRKTYFGFGFAYGFPFHSKTVGKVTVTGSGRNTTENFSEKANIKDVWPYKPLDLGISIGNPTGKLGWEIRPTISTTMTPNFWVHQEDIEGAVFHITGVFIWHLK